MLLCMQINQRKNGFKILVHMCGISKEEIND